MDINKLPFLMLRDYKKEEFNIPISSYLNYSPIKKPNTEEYNVIQPYRQDPLCYIRHVKKDLWVYEINKELKLLPLQRNRDGFVVYKQPEVFYLDYLEHPMFILYKNVSFGNPKVVYLKYTPTTGLPKFEWVDNAAKGTRFLYPEIEWRQELNANLIAKKLYSGKDKINFFDDRHTQLSSESQHRR